MQCPHTPCVGTRRQKVASDTKHLLEELKGRQEKLDQGMDALNMELHKWVQAVHSEVDEATTQFAVVQKEITAQAELSQVCSSLSPKASLQGDDKHQLVLTDQHAGPTETDC